MKKKLILIISAIVIVFAGLSLVIYKANQQSLSYLSISINPDIQLAVDNKDIVEQVLPINEDADIITSDLDLIGKNVEDASQMIIDSAIDTGYIDEYSDENTVVVTTANDNETVRKTLEDKVIAKMNAHFESRKIYPVLVAAGVTDEIKTEAQQYGISNGKMLLVTRASAVNPQLTKETLSTMTVQEIQQEIKAYVTARHDALKVSAEELKTKWQQEKTTLKAAYRDKVEKLKDTILKDSVVNPNTMTPADKKIAIEAAIAAKKQQIINNVGRIKEELKDTTQNQTYPAIKSTIQNIKERLQQSTSKGE